MATIREASLLVHVEVQLVYDRDDHAKKAIAKIEAEREILEEAENLALARIAGQNALGQLASLFQPK